MSLYNRYFSRLPRPSRLGGRLPADALRDHPAGGRQPPALGQHLHLQAVRAALLLAGHPQDQAAHGHQDQELWFRVKKRAVDLFGLIMIIGIIQTRRE